MNAAELFWRIAAKLSLEDPRVAEGTIMNGRCLRVGGEFLALVDYKDSGLVVKLTRARVDELIAEGIGRPFAPAARVFKEWVSVPRPDARRWEALLREGIALASPEGAAPRRPARRAAPKPKPARPRRAR